jgi:hypothetical protein
LNPSLARTKRSGRIKTTDAAKLQDEYAKLVEGLQDDDANADDEDVVMGNPGTCSEGGYKAYSLIIFSTA